MRLPVILVSVGYFKYNYFRLTGFSIAFDIFYVLGQSDKTITYVTKVHNSSLR